mmetsp:Transcript_1445/g.1719  ORF Transcript_1445/g.1719 Transcript_1445/m.1719 type:complete len:559 (-) Transcript_1445:46-1722(-)
MTTTLFSSDEIDEFIVPAFKSLFHNKTDDTTRVLNNWEKGKTVSKIIEEDDGTNHRMFLRRFMKIAMDIFVQKQEQINPCHIGDNFDNDDQIYERTETNLIEIFSHAVYALLSDGEETQYNALFSNCRGETSTIDKDDALKDELNCLEIFFMYCSIFWLGEGPKDVFPDIKKRDTLLIDPVVIVNVLYGIAAECAKLTSLIQEQNSIRRFSEHQHKNSCLDLRMMIDSLKSSSSENISKHIHLDDFVRWVGSTFPNIPNIIKSFVRLALSRVMKRKDKELFLPYVGCPSTAFRTPAISKDEEKSRLFFEIRNLTSPPLLPLSFSPILFSLACMSPKLTGKWNRIYSSEADGFSFNRLHVSLKGYSGPTIILIRDADGGGIFGAYTSSQWKDSTKFFGTNDCFLFTLHPTVKLIRPRKGPSIKDQQNYMYLNHSGFRNKQPRGMGFGGNLSSFRLFITESFENCIANSWDSVFEPQNLLSQEWETKFDVRDLEVWAIGDDAVFVKAIEERAKQRDISEATTRNAALVDKKQFIDDIQNSITGSKIFHHREEAQGRHEFS